MSICLIYDDRPQPWGPYSMPTYFKLALARRDGHGIHLFDQSGEYGYEADLFIFLDDSQHFEPIRPEFHPCAVYVTDTHAGNYQGRLRRAENADFVFACHLSGVEKLSLDLQREVHWLPVACDVERHAEGALPASERTMEVAFVGNFGTTSTGEFSMRRDWLRAAEKICRDVGFTPVFQERYAEDAFEPYKRALVALNFPCNHDLNMRVFEAIAGGAFLLTQPIEDDALNKIGLLHASDHRLFEDTDELRDCLMWIRDFGHWLGDNASKARHELLKHHTYDHRLKQILETCGVAC